MNKLLYGFLLVAATLSLGSCTLSRFFIFNGKREARTGAVDTSKVPVTAHNFVLLPAPDTFVEVAAAPDTAEIGRQLIQMMIPVCCKRLDYRTFSGKSKVHFESPDEQKDFSANIRLRRDTCIWISISALGGMVQVAKLLITPDSVRMVNYLTKEATKVPLSQIAKVLPAQIDFSSLQDLIVGQPFRGGRVTRVKDKGNVWLVCMEDNDYVQDLVYSKDSTLLSGMVSTKKENGPHAASKYESYDQNSGYKFAASRTITIQSGPDTFILNLDFQSSEFNKDIETPFSVPKNYTVKQ